MDVRATTDDPPDTGADTIVVGVFEGKGISHDTEDGALQALVDAGEAQAKLRSLAHVHAAGRRWILVGCGERDAFDPERARIAAATALGRARELGAGRCAGSCRTRSPTTCRARSSRARCSRPTATPS